MFRGFKTVYLFTIKRNVTEKMFKIITFGIAVVLFAAITGLIVLLGYLDKEDETDTTNAETIYFSDKTDLNLDFSYISENEMFKKCKLIDKEIDTPKDKEIILKVEGDNGSYKVNIFTLSGDVVSDEYVEALKEMTINAVDITRYSVAEIDSDVAAIMITEPSVNITKLDDAGKSIGEMIAKMIFPMIFSIVMFIMAVLYGNTISKSMLSEKTSKLLEVLLVSVDAKTIAFGKILAMYTVAIIQFGVWILSIVAGYICGTYANGILNKNYKSAIDTVIHMMYEDAGAFGISNIIIAIISLILGFMLYCFWAGFVSSFARKTEELSSLMVLYQIPVMAGYFIGIMGPISWSRNAMQIVRLIPFSAGFSVPADILVGNITCEFALISNLIMLVFVCVMIVITGKIYKRNIFR